MKTVAGTDVSEDSLVREHDARIRAMAARFAVAVDDLAQEGRMALLRAARHPSRDQSRALWPFAYASVLGAMVNFVTSETARAAVEVAVLDAEPPASAAGPDLAAEARQHVESLDASEQTALLAHLTGRTEHEIAEAMGVHVSTAHRLVTAAKENIRVRA